MGTNKAMFCPKCGSTINTDDTDCLCSTCGWFGDTAETLAEEPRHASLTQSFSELLTAYRKLCREEYEGELIATNNRDRMKIIRPALEAKQEILNLFLALTLKSEGEYQ